MKKQADVVTWKYLGGMGGLTGNWAITINGRTVVVWAHTLGQAIARATSCKAVPA